MGNNYQLSFAIDQILNKVTKSKLLPRNLYRQEHGSSSFEIIQLGSFLLINTKITLANTLFFPSLDYGEVCYLDLIKEQFNKLERLHNVCKYDQIDFRFKLNRLSIRLRRSFSLQFTKYLLCLFHIYCHISNIVLSFYTIYISGS